MSQINDFDKLVTMIQKAVRFDRSTRYAVPRLGQVKKVQDDESLGRVLVICESLGWQTEDQGVWAYPKDIRRLVIPKIDDYVVLEWIDGNRNDAVMYSSIAYWMKNMLPKAFDGESTTQVLFEDNEQEFSVVYDEKEKLIKIIHTGDEYSINLDKNGLTIEDKEGQSWTIDTANKLCEFKSTNDVKLLLDGQNKVTELNDSANSIKTDGNAGLIILENQAGLKGEFLSTKIKLTGVLGSFEVL